MSRYFLNYIQIVATAVMQEWLHHRQVVRSDICSASVVETARDYIVIILSAPEATSSSKPRYISKLSKSCRKPMQALQT